MKITRNNYEIYFIDFLEGNLEKSLFNEFIDFLQENPDLKAELELARPVEMQQEDIIYPGKEKLYKERYDQENVFNLTAIARLEGDLTKTGKADFEQYLSRHPEKQKEAALFEQTKLKADRTIVFPKKRTLYNYPAGRSLLLWSTRIAAVLVLAFLVYRFGGNLISERIIPQNQVAVTETKPQKEDPISTTPKKNRENIQKLLPEEATETAIPKKNTTVAHPVDDSLENSKKVTKKEEIARTRIPVEAPEKLTGRDVSFSVQPSELTLVHIRKNLPEKPERIHEERLLAETIKAKTGLNNLSINKITKAGLSLISSVSKEKFTYQTNSGGDITKLAYDSRLLAFSIPTKNN